MFQVAHTSVTLPQALDCLVVLQNPSPLHNSRIAYHIFIAFVVQSDLLYRWEIKLAAVSKHTGSLSPAASGPHIV